MSAVGASGDRKARVLVVEDEFLFAAMLMYQLAELGFACVGPLGDAAAASAAVGRERIDAALVSARLAGSEGIVANLTGHQIPVAVIVEQPEGVPDGPLAGLPSVRKPYDVADVKRVVERLLAGRPIA